MDKLASQIDWGRAKDQFVIACAADGRRVNLM